MLKMSSTNQSLQFQKAEGKFLAAKTNEERLDFLDEMIRECPKHKSAESMLANLKTRRKKLIEKIENTKKSSKKQGKKGIKKEDMQAVIVGFTNSGKSSLLKLLTNARVDITDFKFATKNPVVGMMFFSGTQIQLVEVPAIESELFDKSITHTADTILILINNFEQLTKIQQKLKSNAKQIIVFNKIELLNENEKRKIRATLKSKKYNFITISCKTKENLEELKEKIFLSFGKIRVYAKEPGKEKSPRPVILSPETTVKHVAEKILHGFSNKIKETKIWGPSSKFPGQKVGLSHVLKDLDVVEFKTK